MWEQRQELWQWLENGAIVYVCGDASNMAKDVDKCLHEIIQEKLSTVDAAKAYMARLRKEKRYLRDIY